jgi:hypothetical protein
MTLSGGKVIDGTAFYDSIAFNELWDGSRPDLHGHQETRRQQSVTALGARPVPLGCFEDELPGGHRVERRVDEHLERYPVQVRVALPLQVKPVLRCSVLTTSCSIASASCPKLKMTKDSPNTECCASSGRTWSVRFGRSASFTSLWSWSYITASSPIRR